MVDNDIEPGNLENPENGELDNPAAEKTNGEGGGLKSLLSGGKLKVLLAFPAAGLLSAVAVGLLMFGGDDGAKPPEATPVAAYEPVRPLIASSRAKEIAAFRSELRRTNRSARNAHLKKRLDADELYRLAVRGELALVSGMLDNYVATTARFYELFRIMANDYVEQPAQLLKLFEDELLPDYRASERRRRMMRRRVEHDPAIELYNRLDYIAYHDSIAVSSFQEFLIEGGTDNFANTAGLVNKSKFMIKDFRDQLEVHLKEFDMEYNISDNLWDRYYGKWPW